MEFEGFDGIDEYLLNYDKCYPINIKQVKHIVEEISAYTGLTKEQSKSILTLFFYEIRAAILRGEFVSIRRFGILRISKSLKLNINFKAAMTLIRKMNGK